MSFLVDGSRKNECEFNGWKYVSYSIRDERRHEVKWEFKKIRYQPDWRGSGWVDDVCISYPSNAISTIVTTTIPIEKPIVLSNVTITSLSDVKIGSISDVSTSQISNITADSLLDVNAGRVSNITADSLLDVSAGQVSNITADSLLDVSAGQVSNITADSLSGVSTGQVSNVTAGLLMANYPIKAIKYVNKNPDPINYTYGTINEAIHHVAEGGTVVVASGTYAENVCLYKSITLIAESVGDTIIQLLDYGSLAIP